eukprot:gene30454-35464_t
MHVRIAPSPVSCSRGPTPTSAPPGAATTTFIGQVRRLSPTHACREPRRPVERVRFTPKAVGASPEGGLSEMSRRGVMSLATAVVLTGGSVGDAVAVSSATAGDWSSPGLNFFKTPSGVKVQNLDMGEGGVEAATGDLVLFDYVLRRSNGYFIYGTVEGVSFQPKDTPIGPIAFRLGSSPLISGLQEVLLGMTQGAKRRALVPPDVGYLDCGKDEPQPPTFATQRQLANHCREPLLFEIQLLRITKA